MAKRIATEARAFAQAQGIPTGKRGRLSATVFSLYLSSLPTSNVRVLAAENGVEVAPRGRISDATIDSLSQRLR
jgi:hypothetical protein